MASARHTRFFAARSSIRSAVRSPRKAGLSTTTCRPEAMAASAHRSCSEFTSETYTSEAVLRSRAGRKSSNTVPSVQSLATPVFARRVARSTRCTAGTACNAARTLRCTMLERPRIKTSIELGDAQTGQQAPRLNVDEAPAHQLVELAQRHPAVAIARHCREGRIDFDDAVLVLRVVKAPTFLRLHARIPNGRLWRVNRLFHIGRPRRRIVDASLAQHAVNRRAHAHDIRIARLDNALDEEMEHAADLLHEKSNHALLARRHERLIPRGHLAVLRAHRHADDLKETCTLVGDRSLVTCPAWHVREGNTLDGQLNAAFHIGEPALDHVVRIRRSLAVRHGLIEACPERPFLGTPVPSASERAMAGAVAKRDAREHGAGIHAYEVGDP